MSQAEQHRIAFDKGTGRPILMSPVRHGRPRNTGPLQDGAKDCPFCAGNEHLTTAQEGAEPPPESGAPWQARAFANLYPATSCHEVIAEGARHTTHPAELTHEELRHSLAIYRDRIRAAETRPEVECSFLFKNVGAAAGSSIAHNHSQLIGLPLVPPRLAAELAACRERGCLHCEEIATAERDGRLVHRGAAHVILCPSTPKLPFETWFLPLSHDDDFLAPGDDEDLLQILHRAYAGIDQAFAGSPFNSFLHRIPGVDFHWHIEFQPRVGQVAALELGGDMYINPVLPTDSAARWRGDEG